MLKNCQAKAQTGAERQQQAPTFIAMVVAERVVTVGHCLGAARAGLPISSGMQKTVGEDSNLMISTGSCSSGSPARQQARTQIRREMTTTKATSISSNISSTTNAASAMLQQHQIYLLLLFALSAAAAAAAAIATSESSSGGERLEAARNESFPIWHRPTNTDPTPQGNYQSSGANIIARARQKWMLDLSLWRLALPSLFLFLFALGQSEVERVMFTLGPVRAYRAQRWAQ